MEQIVISFEDGGLTHLCAIMGGRSVLPGVFCYLGGLAERWRSVR